MNHAAKTPGQSFAPRPCSKSHCYQGFVAAAVLCVIVTPEVDIARLSDKINAPHLEALS
jgi:hypothetical protein